MTLFRTTSAKLFGSAAAPQGSVADFIASMDRRQQSHLKSILVGTDASAMFLAVVSVLLVGPFRTEQGLRNTAIATIVFVVAGLWAMRGQGLWLARVSAIRVIELTRITRAMFILAITMIVFDRIAHFGLYVRHVTVASLIAWLFVVISRSAYRTWLSTTRARDRYCRQVVMVGADEEVLRLIRLFTTHRELGVRVAGVIGGEEAATSLGLGSLWLGRIDDAERIVKSARVSGVIVSRVVDSERLNTLIRTFQSDGVHVHVATGIAGIDARRMRSLPVAHEPLLYIEAPTLGRAQLMGKRVFDMAASGFAVLVFSPVMIAVAIAIKACDRGPVFFKQQRVGHAGTLFGVFKFRTMAVDAEQRLAQLGATNERNGPLFKMQHDPRVTRVGRFLRTSSLDELPQLFNVLRGEMSLVGPRPALPKEVDEFPEDLRRRDTVVPGITGLWQSEARDNPSFEAYRRLDLFYVENWSITLDLLIIITTVEQLGARLLSAVRPAPRIVRDALPALVTTVSNGSAVESAVQSHAQ